MSSDIPVLFKPNQVEENTEEVARLEHTLKQPNVQDPGHIVQQIKSMKKQLHELTPTPFASNEVDAAARKAKELQEQFTEGMPTAEEMRRSPPGAVGKHMRWDAANKRKIKLWKYLQQRLYAGSNDADVANVERFRPTGGPQQMSMDNAQIPVVTKYYMPPIVKQAAVMSDEQSDKLKEIDPDLHDKMALLTTEQRSSVLSLVQRIIDNPGAKVEFGPPKPHKTRDLPEEERSAIGHRLAAARKQKREAAKALAATSVESATSEAA